MSDPVWQCVCHPEVATSLIPADFCSTTSVVNQSPIDDYYGYVEHLLTLGDEATLMSSETLGRLLLLGLVSGVEVYFRSLIAGVVHVCPVSRGHASEQQIPFGALDYYGAKDLEWSLFEGTSFASAREVLTRTKKLIGVDIRPGTSVHAALEEYDKVCHFRHAAVHARGALGPGNASALGLTSDIGRRSVQLTLATLHDGGLICHSAVRAYNRYIYQRLIERWIGNRVISGEWAHDKSLFGPLYRLFYSDRDRTGPRRPYDAYRSLRTSLDFMSMVS